MIKTETIKNTGINIKTKIRKKPRKKFRRNILYYFRQLIQNKDHWKILKKSEKKNNFDFENPEKSIENSEILNNFKNITVENFEES